MALTPYYQTTVEISPTKCVPEPDVNYTPYNLFCLTSRVRPYLTSINPDYNPRLVTEQHGNRMVWTVKVFKYDLEVTLPENELRQLQLKVDEITSESKTHCILFDCRSFVATDECNLPTYWVTSVLPFIPLDSKY